IEERAQHADDGGRDFANVLLFVPRHVADFLFWGTSVAVAVLERASEILRQIRLHATPDVQRLTLELEPAELGRLSIQLALRAGKLTAIVRAESAATLEALEQRENELRSVLAERGITADSMRFELGFGQHSRGYARARAAAETPRERASVAPPHTLVTTLPPAAPLRLDTYA
ncbi:MAG: flagellar hook-length control protein FliK, partial [Planctomycetes bacterium]|nr:flagellar hook-length control protein FliK [Planctomycetota bacterium]